MNWFRRSRRSGGWLALFALAFQLAVSFGHVHGLETSAGTTGSALAQADNPSAARGSKKAPASPDVCAICAVMALTASSVVPTAPQPLVVLTDVRVHFRPATETALSVAAYAAFRARAPPV
jgi:hypothetical protein